MLKSDDAAARLRAVHSSDWGFARLCKLPAKLSELGRALMSVKDDGKPFDWQDRSKKATEAAPKLFALSPRDRLKIFAALQPHLADDLEATYQLCARFPYQLGSYRRAYRAPGDAAALASPCFQNLLAILQSLQGYTPDNAAWVAAWAPHLGSTDCLGRLCAAAIDRGNSEVADILKASATNQHEIGNMGRHVVRGLVSSAQPENWEFVEKLLLAAQRQEGLRQVILECIDEAHPTAFRRMIALIVDNELLRFSATVRAVDVWFGLQWTVLTPAVLRDTVRRVHTLLEDDATRAETLKTGKGEDFYFALWCVAFEDANKAIPFAVKAVKDTDTERRYAAVHLLCDLNLEAARQALPQFLEDDDLRIAYRALPPCPNDSLTFEGMVKLLERTPEKYKSPGALIWPWNSSPVSRTWPADRLPHLLGKRSPEDLLPYLPMMGYSGKNETIDKLAKQKKWSPTTRQALLAMLGDKQSWVRSSAARALEKATLTDEELLLLEPLLIKKASDIRSTVTRMLSNRKPAKALESADRLIAHKKLEPRLGGLEILRLLTGKNEAVKDCQQRVAAYAEAHEELSDAEKSAIEEVRDHGKPRPTLDNALGLMTAPLNPMPPVKGRKVVCVSKAAVACLKALDALVAQHAKEIIEFKTWRGPQSMALGAVGGSFPSPDVSKPCQEEVSNLPLREVWQTWYRERPASQRDKDGLELLRAAAWVHSHPDQWKKARDNEDNHWHPARDLWANGQEPAGLQYSGQVGSLLAWLTYLDMPTDAPKWLMDTTETMFSLVPESERTRVIALNANWQERQKEWRNNSCVVMAWYNLAAYLKNRTLIKWTDADHSRWWQLAAWRDRPAAGVRRFRPDLNVILAAHKTGVATDDDLYDALLGPEQQWQDLGRLTSHPRHDDRLSYTPLEKVALQCRDRILETELARGELPTTASPVARYLNSCFGLDLLMRLLGALGHRPFSSSYYGSGRAEVFTYLIGKCYPLAEDTPEEFAERMQNARIPTERLLALAFLAPQWLRHVAHTVGWDGLQEGVWWLMTHTHAGSAGAWASEETLKPEFKLNDIWTRILRERTSLTETEMGEHLVDVEWFHRVYQPLGKKRWEQLLVAARASSGGRSQAKKAGFLADVLLGKAKKKDLVDRIKIKLHREAVRLLGLLPLAKGPRRDADLESRYKVLMVYRRHARSLSPMGREGAIRDLEIGLSNLARTAGYPDATRLGWAMEAREMADLAAGPINVTQDGVTVTLSLDESNKPQITVRRGDKPLKSVPPAVRKKKKVQELTARTAELRRQASRVRQGLETMMCRAESFSGGELKQLFSHPLLRPLLERLVLVGEGIAGYPTSEGMALRDHTGKLEPVKDKELLRLAHPHDLFSRGDWHAWQAECFKAERVQPFKQVFRELYVVTNQEKEDKIESKRYAGHQVNPSQTTALFGSRGWATKDGIVKTFHEAGLIAEVYAEHHGWTAAEVEGLTFGSIRFRKRGEWQPVPLEEVPPIIFSETMRDGDLVVSVAHVGGVDPEASAGTVEMRSTLLKETLSLFNLKNVKIKDRHALIDGTLSNYTVHLGSAGVHKMPGGHVCIVAVPAQHRGRLFLPFADEDPKTAEVISKVLLLARDHEIQDPSILEQLQ